MTLPTLNMPLVIIVDDLEIHYGHKPSLGSLKAYFTQEAKTLIKRLVDDSHIDHVYVKTYDAKYKLTDFTCRRLLMDKGEIEMEFYTDSVERV